MIGKLIEALRTVEIDFDDHSLADAIWLACQTGAGTTAGRPAAAHVSPKAPLGASAPLRASVTGVEEKPAAAHVPEARTAALRALGVGDAGRASGSLRLPAPRALRKGLNAALAPLAVRNPRPGFAIDLEATVDAFAVSGTWSEQYARGERRWLRAALVTEIGPQSPIWKSTLDEFSDLLRTRGAFRSVRRHELLTGPLGDAQLRVRGTQQERDARRTVWGRDEIIIVASDFVSSPWPAAYGHCIERWRETNHVLLLHLLPQHLWGRTWTGVPEWQVSGQVPGGDNSSLLASARKIRRGRKNSQASPLPIPVAGLTPDDLRSWSAVVVAQPGRALAIGLAARLGAPQTIAATETVRTAESLVRAFKANASSLCIKLGTYLSLTAPLTFQMMQWVQIAMVRDASTAEIAEFFLSGLVEKKYPAADAADVVYDFIPGVRELLERGISILEAIDVQQAVGAKLELDKWTSGTRGSLVDVEMIAARTDAPEPIRMFAEVSASYLKRSGFRSSPGQHPVAPPHSPFLEPCDIGAKVAATLGGFEYIVKQLLIFSTQEQHTWLVFSTGSLVIVLDEKKTRETNQEIQVTIPLDTHFVVHAAEESDGSHTVGFGNETDRWYYSKDLYMRPRLLEDAIADVLRLTRAKARLHSALAHAASSPKRLTPVGKAVPFFSALELPPLEVVSVSDLLSLSKPFLRDDGSSTHVLYASLNTSTPMTGAHLFDADQRALIPHAQQARCVVRFSFGRALKLLDISNMIESLMVEKDRSTIETDIIFYVSQQYRDVDGVIWQLSKDPSSRLVCLLVPRIKDDLLIHEVSPLVGPSTMSEESDAAYDNGLENSAELRHEIPIKEVVSEVDLTRTLRVLIDKGAVPNLRHDIEAALISAVDEADWIVEADSYLTVEPDDEHGELMSWDFHSDDDIFTPSSYENGILIVACTLNALIRVQCSFNFSAKDHIDKDMVPMGNLNASREIRFGLDAELIFIGIEEGHPVLDGVEIQHVAERVDFGNVEPQWDADHSDVTNYNSDDRGGGVDNEKRAEDFIKTELRYMNEKQIIELADHESEASKALRDSYFEKYPLSFFNDRDVYLHKSRFQHTATDLAKQLDVNFPSGANLMGEMASAAYERGLKNFVASRFEDAIDDFTSALAIDDARPNTRAAAQYNRALAHTAAGNVRAAKDDYEAVIMSPDVSAEIAKAATDNLKKLTSRRGPRP